MGATNTFVTLPYASPVVDAGGKLTPAWNAAIASNLVPTLASLTAAVNAAPTLVTLSGVVQGSENAKGELLATFASQVLINLGSKTPITVSGSWASGTAQKSILAELVSLCICKDSTTA